MNRLWLMLILVAGAHAVSAAPTNTVASLRAYRVAPKDVVEIKVYRQPDLDTRARVAEDGTVIMPLLGAVLVGGRTADEARQMIHRLLAQDYLVDPQVSVAVVEFGKRLFTVMGEVQRPGSYEMPPDEPVNVLQAIAQAGGYTRLGAPGRVAVQRREGNQKRVYKIDTSAMATDERVEPFLILPGDTITVGERFF